MIISKTPYRISLFGGGTDYPAWYQRHGGSVIATAIDKYCYITARVLPPFFDHKYRFSWSKVEHCKDLEECSHPAIKGVINYLNMQNLGLEVHCIGDLPARSGMGSSSSFTVGLLNALYGIQGKLICKDDLALQAINIEQNILKENVGSQDQVTAAHGGFNHITFSQSGDITVSPLTLKPERLQELTSHLMLFYTGIKRTASDIASTFVNSLDEKRRQLRIMSDLVQEAISILHSDQDIRNFGELFVEAWDAKKGLSKMVSNSNVDDIHAQALQAGAIGGKITGAGGGGFLLLFVPPDLQQQVREKLCHFVHVPFNIDYGGSQIMFASRENNYSEVTTWRLSHPISEFQELT